MTSQDLINDQSWLQFGALILTIALVGYCFLWFGKAKSELRGYRTAMALRALLFRLPSSYPPPLVHVLLALALLVGASMSFAGAIASRFHSDFHLTVESTSLVFGILIAFIALYTLWQTIKLEENQGLIVKGFRPFVERLVKDLEVVVRSQGHACLGRRILVISTNPFFGTLSFKDDPLTQDYQSYMEYLAKLAKGGAIRCEMICGDVAALDAFHQAYYKTSSTAQQDIADADTRTNNFITRIDDAAGSTVVHRKAKVPRVQFVIVGNVLHEFLLTAEDMYTEVRHVRRTEDMLIADRYAEFFDILKD